jgi:large subunit ribosomal protein L35
LDLSTSILHRCRAPKPAAGPPALPEPSASIHRSMPKMKTHSGAKKRFKKTAKGKLLARHSFTSHNLGKKSAKRKRHLGRPVVVAEADHKRVTELMHK